MGDHFGISIESIKKGLAGYFPRLNRTELIAGPDFNVFLDAYNANPSSMEATLRGIHSQDYGKITLFLGDMFELGPESHAMHVELVSLVKELFPQDRLVGVGKEMAAAIAEVGHGLAYVDFEKAAAHAKELAEGSKLVLIKGSRGMALERLLPFLGIARKGDH
jgi:UDP-N-acetylmuramoyl-tripeptide--D-alanyl-D-alanine ligase